MNERPSEYLEQLKRERPDDPLIKLAEAVDRYVFEQRWSEFIKGVERDLQSNGKQP